MEQKYPWANKAPPLKMLLEKKEQKVVLWYILGTTCSHAWELFEKETSGGEKQKQLNFSEGR